jgi:hypothetical protein
VPHLSPGDPLIQCGVPNLSPRIRRTEKFRLNYDSGYDPVTPPPRFGCVPFIHISRSWPFLLLFIACFGYSRETVLPGVWGST